MCKAKEQTGETNYVTIRAGPFSREAMRTFSLGKVLADLTASQTVILAFKGSLPGGMANTRHMESGVTEGDNL